MNDHHRDLGGTGQNEGRYANYFEVAYSDFEFLIDFGQYQGHGQLPGQVARVVTIVTGPTHAKTLATMLFESVRHYESEHGVLGADAAGAPTEPGDAGGA